MDFGSAIAYLKRVKALGSREEEIGIPLPEETEHPAEVPAGENFTELLDAGAGSFHESLLLSDFPYSVKGSFAFSALSRELAENSGVKYGKEGGVRVFRFGKTRNADWAERIEAARDQKKTEGVFSALPRKASLDREIETQFAVHGDGKNVHCHMRLGAQWKRIFSMPFAENVWHVPGRKFLAAYSPGKNVYGIREFHPSLGNLLFAAVPDAEYGWIEERADLEKLAGSAEQFAEIYSEAYGLKGTLGFRDFLLLSASLKKAAFAEMKVKRLYAPEFFANIPYMLSRAEYGKAKGDTAEALFLLRTAADLSLLALRAAPAGGSMLELAKFFDSNENIAPKRFALGKSLVEMLENLGADFGEKGKGGIKLEEGRDFFAQNGAISMDFGMVAAILHSSSFFMGQNTGDRDRAFWKGLKSAGAALFVASYGKGAALSLLEEGSEIPMGSDIIKAEKIGSKIVVKRAMACESGKAKEIKPHLARIIEIADRRSADENACLGEMGSWGEAVYEVVQRHGRAAAGGSQPRVPGSGPDEAQSPHIAESFRRDAVETRNPEQGTAGVMLGLVSSKRFY